MSTYTLRTPVSAGLDIEEGCFVGLTVPVEDQAAAMDVIARLRAEHPAAMHVCWALLADGQSSMSDDGEPSGTAGRPILEMLCHHDLDTTLGAVMHYFGGVKLGADGLVRTYTDAIATVFMQAERVERVTSTTLALATGYANEARIHRRIDDRGYVPLDAAYDAGVTLTMRLPVMDEAATRVALRDLTQGRVVITQRLSLGNGRSGRRGARATRILAIRLESDVGGYRHVGSDSLALHGMQMCIGFGRLGFVALGSDGVQHGLEAFEAQHSQLWIGNRLGRLLQAHLVLAAVAKIVFELRVPFR